GVEGDAEVAKAGENVGAAGLVRDDDVPHVPDLGRLDMLVEGGVLLYRRYVQSRLVREGRRFDVGRVPVGRSVEPVVEQTRDVGQALQPLFRHAGLVAHLQHQRRDDRDEVGIAAALAQTSQGALYLARPGSPFGPSVGVRIVGVVTGTVD